MIIIAPATEAHIDEMKDRLRQADIDEFFAGWGQTPENGMRLGLKISRYAWAGIYKGKVVAICGLHQPMLIGELGIPWMVGTTNLEDPTIRREFLKTSKEVLRVFTKACPKLENWIDARNTVAIRWLKWLGFTIHEPEPYGLTKLPFHRFTMEVL